MNARYSHDMTYPRSVHKSFFAAVYSGLIAEKHCRHHRSAVTVHFVVNNIQNMQTIAVDQPLKRKFRMSEVKMGHLVYPQIDTLRLIVGLRWKFIAVF